jgi:hypothetical protein
MVRVRVRVRVRVIRKDGKQTMGNKRTLYYAQQTHRVPSVAHSIIHSNAKREKVKAGVRVKGWG